jgi:hypothetical protein
MVLAQNKEVRTVTLEKVAFLCNLPTNPTKKNIYINDYSIISTATPNISAIRHNISTNRQISQKLPSKLASNPTPAPLPLQKKKH